MKKYITILKNALSTSFEYRAQLTGIVLQEFFSFAGIFLLWLFIYRTNPEIAGYDFNQTINYYLFIPFIGVLTKVTIAEHLGKDIKDGDISSALLKPYNVGISFIYKDIGKKINWLLLISPLYVLIVFVLYKKSLLLISLNSLIPLGIILIFALLMNFMLDILISWLAFFVDDVWSFKHFKRIAVLVFGGVTFPFEFVPEKFRWLFDVLPFKFLYYIPNSYLIGSRTIESLLPDIFLALIWTLVFIIIGRFLWKVGTKKYGAFGR